MKKCLIFSLLAILAVCGCNVEDKINTQEPLSEGKVFTATIEDNNSGGTKTSLDANGNVLWKQRDQVSIFDGSTINEQYQVTDESDGKTAASLYRVTNPGYVAGTDIDNNVAFYPYGSTASLTKSGTSYIISDITLPATQNYAENSFGNGAFPMAAVTTSTSEMNLKFKNVLGGLKLQLKGTATIKSVSMTGNNNEILCGAAEVTVSNGNVPSISLTDATAKTVTLNCGSGVQLNTETATSFIIALPPVTMTAGFTVIVKDTEGKQMEISTTKSQTITRSSLLKMPSVNFVGIPVVEHQSIDLGLSSGLKWASCNVGATSPEEYGDYFTWGDTEPYYSIKDPLTWKEGKSLGFNWGSYKWGSSNNNLTKYNHISSKGIVDNKTILDPEDDAAHVNWGGTWRMPTIAECTELINECTWTWTIQNGVSGRLVTGPNGNSIFIPASGYGYNKNFYQTESKVELWSSSLSTTTNNGPSCAWILYAGSADYNIGVSDYNGRYTARSIRPVSDKGVRVSVSGISLNQSSITLMTGESVTLEATVLPSNATQPTVIWSSSNTEVAKVNYAGKVTAIAAGSIIIRAITYDGGFTATCTINVESAP